MFIRNGQEFNIHEQHEINGITYPRDFFNNETIRAEFGITEIPDPAPPVSINQQPLKQAILHKAKKLESQGQYLQAYLLRKDQ